MDKLENINESFGIIKFNSFIQNSTKKENAGNASQKGASEKLFEAGQAIGNGKKLNSQSETK